VLVWTIEFKIYFLESVNYHFLFWSLLYFVKKFLMLNLIKNVVKTV